MKISDSNLITPVYLKTDPDMPWPKEESVFHLLTGDGLFLCRNHQFYTSSCPVSDGPAELASHEPFANLKFPKIPQRMFEQVVGYFDLVGVKFGAESAVLFAWNQTTEAVELIVPEQRSLVGSDWYGRPFPINVWYDVPTLPDNLIVFGDAHCHVDGAAYASHTDVEDEVHRPGLHIVVGRTHEEPPDFHFEVVVDGVRFRIKNLESIIEGYEKRRPDEVPGEWIDRVTVIPWKPKSYASDSANDGGYGDDYYPS